MKNAGFSRGKLSGAEFAFRGINSLFSPVGGSHYLLLDEISQNLHQHGHDVRMLLQLGNPVITGTSVEKCSILCSHVS